MKRGGMWRCCGATDATMPEVYALEEGKLRKLTAHNDALMATLNLATTENLAAKANDGNDVHGSADDACGVHGWDESADDPVYPWRAHGQDQHDFDAARQLFAAHGYAVLNVNYRGSTGRGQAYSTAINADWGHKEVLDLLAMTDAAIATGKIDAEKLGVGGWSYGGISDGLHDCVDDAVQGGEFGRGDGESAGVLRDRPIHFAV